MVRSVTSAFWEELQKENPNICSVIDLDMVNVVHRWTTRNHPLVKGGFTYEPFPGAASGGIQEGIDLGIATIDFIVANSAGFFDKYIKSQTIQNSTIKISRIIASSPDLDEMIQYKGRVAEIGHNRLQMSGRARSIFDSGLRDWPYYTYTDQCQWRFTSPGCALVESTITTSAVIEASSFFGRSIVLNSGTITASGFAAGDYDVGKITFISGQNSGFFRMIRSHTGDILELTHRMPFVPNSGDFVNIRRGCRKRFLADCVSTWNNSSNFLGFQWIPRQEQAF